jgi:predicted Fe-Mo cluster-binding NifX family protein
MKIVIPANNPDLDASVSSVFGRSPYFLFFDCETGQLEAKVNPSTKTLGGAGIQAAQYVVKQGAQAVLAKKVGPKAEQVLEKAEIIIFAVDGKTARQVLDHFKSECP